MICVFGCEINTKSAILQKNEDIFFISKKLIFKINEYGINGMQKEKKRKVINFPCLR